MDGASMTADEIIGYCLRKKGAYIDFPFGEIPMCIKVANRLFAQIYPRPDDYKITLNCDRAMGEILRSKYPGAVVRGYHCPPRLQPYFNTVYLDGNIPDDELRSMIDHSYTVVVGKLSKKAREELQAI
jgi:predicted DNA-binding protein (MmcQ/YjbR family)